MLQARAMRLAAILHDRFWFTRAVTLGVRVVVLDPRGVFLVRHSYVPGWYLPGGGVDRGESAETAAVRELWEEGGIHCRSRPTLHGFFRNGRHDHVACYVVRDAEAPAATPLSAEIVEGCWFAPEVLPEGTTTATRARVAEVLGNHRPPVDW